MKNALVAAALNEIADRLDLDGVSFKPRAYRRAAEAIASLTEPIEAVVERGTHGELPGVGAAIAKKIEEFVSAGRLAYLDELRARLPIDLYALTQVEGIGPKTAKLLYDELGVRNLKDLERAARSESIRGIKGLGAKTEQRILRGLGEAHRLEGRILLGEASSLADSLIADLQATKRFTRIMAAGSLRRGRETIGDLDLLTVAPNPESAAQAFTELPQVREVLARGEKKTSVRLTDGLQVDLRIVPAESFGAALQYFTGSKAHNVALRKRAVTRGWKLNEYGLYDKRQHPLAGKAEADIYARLGLQEIPPELREDQGEIQQAEEGKLPRLVELADVRGDLHVHTDRSDGKASLEEMVAAAQEHGLMYIAITDHAKFAEVIGGMTPDDLRAQLDEISGLNEKLKPFRILSGVEANVQEDGTLDVPDQLLGRLDVVIAAIHSHFRLPKNAMTERLIRAVEHERVGILAHPTGRKIGERPGYEADWDEVFRRAAAANTAFEINANPIRLDLNAELVRRAVNVGCTFSIGTDAHRTAHFDFMRFGVITARRGWAKAEDILNCNAAEALCRSKGELHE
ncbi:DNA polymerase/3'-5' exonuclease PolX [Candidatus Bipolaricaulota bacterium]|nr:DNA polymerase/3'-5' exonuclease PolX [Candidatus Bipolaricaulota bacterium]